MPTGKYFEIIHWRNFAARSREAIPFANINLVNEVSRELERAVTVLGCRGLKLLPSYQNWSPIDSRAYRLYATAQEMGIPVLFHTGSSVFAGSRLRYADPLLLDDIATDFPRLTIVQAIADAASGTLRLFS